MTNKEITSNMEHLCKEFRKEVMRTVVLPSIIIGIPASIAFVCLLGKAVYEDKGRESNQALIETNISEYTSFTNYFGKVKTFVPDKESKLLELVE